MQQTGPSVHAVMPAQTPPHPPPMMLHTQYTPPSSTPNASPVTLHQWAQPPPQPVNSTRVTTTTSQTLLQPNPWAAVSPSVQSTAVPPFASPPPAASPVHSTQYPGSTTVYHPSSTPQPPSFWGIAVVPTPPPATQSTTAVPYNAHPPLPTATQTTHQPPKVAYSQYQNMAVSAAPIVAAPVPSPSGYSVYQTNPLAPVNHVPVVSIASQAPGKPYVSTTGVQYYQTTGPINHNSAPPPLLPGTATQGTIGGIIVPTSVSAAPYSHGTVTGPVTVASNPDPNNPIIGNLGPQRGLMYTQPSQMQGYHPYRRM